MVVARVCPAERDTTCELRVKTGVGQAVGPIGAGGSPRYRGRMPNFVLLDTSQPDITQLLVAMLQARHAVAGRSWSHPQQAAGEDWWADVLADPRARKRGRRVDTAIKQATYRLADELRATILVACSKCDWKAAYGRNDLIASHSAECPMPSCSTNWRSQDVHGSETNGIIAGCITLSRLEP